jgi:dipeptidyl aminopeptidase/acylaminoacyl peptidase
MMCVSCAARDVGWLWGRRIAGGLGRWLLLLVIAGAAGCGSQPSQPTASQSGGDRSGASRNTESNATAANATGQSAKAAASGNAGESAKVDSDGSQLQSPPTELIPRRTIFGNPDRVRARISPDGSQIAFVAPRNGVLNVWVAPYDDLDAARPVTEDRRRGIVEFSWAYTSRHLLYTQDKNGDEDDHVYCVTLATGDVHDLTPVERIAARIEAISEHFPDEILVGINDRDQRFFHDIYRVNIETGDRRMVQQNPGFGGFLIDEQFQVRFAVTTSESGGMLILRRDDAGEWVESESIDAVDAMTTSPVGFDESGNLLYWIDSRGRDTSALVSVDLKSGARQLLAEDPRADLGSVLVDPAQKHVQAASFTYARTEWKVLDPAIQPDFDFLRTVAPGELQITSRSLDDRRWTVAYLVDSGPARFYLYEREPKRAIRYLFSSNSVLESLPLVPMNAVTIPTRDQLELVAYLSLPKESDPRQTGRPAQPVPMVLSVHGGPWARDEWGYDPEHQLWANRGYAVLAVNYRGSTGFGKSFINRANQQWAGTMHDDLVDAVQWAIEQKIAQPDKVAIMGGSYGGYATLVGLTLTPRLFACGVDIVGPSNLVTLLENPPPYWMPQMPVMKLRVGDVATEEGRRFLESRSPLFHVDKIERPLLIAQGANDPRVKRVEADQIVAAMRQRSIPVTYMLFLDEGHGFAIPENRFAFYAVTEAFLQQHLGGRAEPMQGAFTGSNFEVPEGADQIPGFDTARNASP